MKAIQVQKTGGPEVLTLSVGVAFATVCVVVATDELKFPSPL